MQSSVAHPFMDHSLRCNHTVFLPELYKSALCFLYDTFLIRLAVEQNGNRRNLSSDSISVTYQPKFGLLKGYSFNNLLLWKPGLQRKRLKRDELYFQTCPSAMPSWDTVSWSRIIVLIERKHQEWRRSLSPSALYEISQLSKLFH